MSVLDIDKLLGHTKNRIYMVGIELEGAWTVLPPKTRLVHDGSVKDFDTVNNPIIGIGELPSPPIEVGKTRAKMESWIHKFYPQLVNHTCGLHVHMSFKLALHYQKLMDVSYQDTILAYLNKWAMSEGIVRNHPIWGRLRGESEFCQTVFTPDHQVRARTKNYHRNFEGHRYTAINYCHGLHGTIECRVLPMFDNPDVAVKAVNHVLDITNACIVKLGGREEKLKGEISVPEKGELELIEVRI